MDGLFPNPTATTIISDLGRSAFIRQQVMAESMDVGQQRIEVRRQLRDRCPRLPGVYAMVDPHGELIYVGMSSHLQDRLLTYFTKGPPDAKEQRVATHTHHLLWEVGDHDLTVRLRELELIRRWRPRFNSVGRPGRREIGFICLTSSEAPNFRFGRQPPRHGRPFWGPLPLTRRTRTAVTRLNHLFLLRDCPNRVPVRFTDQLTMLADDCQPGCLRGDVGTCLAPCAGDRGKESYLQCVADARSFLDGRDRKIIDRFEAAMHQAAAEQRYEQAATHRDTWQSLCALWDQLAMVRTAGSDHAGIHVLSGRSGKSWWALLAGGKVASILRQPSSKRAARQCRRLLDATFPAGDAALAKNRGESDDYEQMRIVVSWYRQHPEFLSMVMPPDQALEICRQHCGSQ